MVRSAHLAGVQGGGSGGGGKGGGGGTRFRYIPLFVNSRFCAGMMFSQFFHIGSGNTSVADYISFSVKAHSSSFLVLAQVLLVFCQLISRMCNIWE